MAKKETVVSVILTILGVGGTIAIPFLATKAAKKVEEQKEMTLAKKEEKRADILEENYEAPASIELDKKEEFKIYAKAYAPTIAVTVGSIVCVLGANLLNKKQQASIAAAYGLVSTGFNKYKSKVIEVLGIDNHNKVIDAIAKEECKPPEMITHPTFFSDDTLEFGEDNLEEKHLFYDAYSQRYFESTLNKVLQAEYTLNRNFALGSASTLNDWYDLLGISHIEGGDDIGFEYLFQDGIGWIDFSHHIAENIDNNGQNAYIIEFVFYPEKIDWY